MSEIMVMQENIKFLEGNIPYCKEKCELYLDIFAKHPHPDAITAIGIDVIAYNLDIVTSNVRRIQNSFHVIEMCARSYRDRLTEQEKMETANRGLRVDLNASRRRALSEYTAIVKFTEEMIQKTEAPEDIDELRDYFDGLRSSLLSLAYTYIPDDPDFRDISDEIGDVPVFMEEDE